MALLTLLVCVLFQDTDTLIDQLGSDDLVERQQATDKLLKLGKKVGPALRKAAASDDAEIRARARELLSKMFAVNEAAKRALDWLERHQTEDGSWSVKGCRKCGEIGHEDHDAGITGLATLALLRGGGSKKSIKKALKWLVSSQGKEGCIGSRNAMKYMYNHIMGTLALIEASRLGYGEKIRAGAKRALRFLLQSQNPGQGWRYSMLCGDNDSIVTTWAVLALKSGERAKFEVPKKAFDGARCWVREVIHTDGRAGYTHAGVCKVWVPSGGAELYDPNEARTAGCVATGLLSEKQRETGLALINKCLPSDKRLSLDYIWWHFGTLSKPNPKWIGTARTLLLKLQVKEGCAKGSWNPVGQWGGEAGRVYGTALNALTLLEIERLSQEK